MRPSGRLTRFMGNTDYQVSSKRTMENNFKKYMSSRPRKRICARRFYTLLPLHLSFCRTTLKKETSGNAASGRVFLALRMVIVDPFLTRIGGRPSKVRKTG